MPWWKNDPQPNRPAYYIDEVTFSDGGVCWKLYVACEPYWSLKTARKPTELEELKAQCDRLNNPTREVGRKRIHP